MNKLPFNIFNSLDFSFYLLSTFKAKRGDWLQNVHVYILPLKLTTKNSQVVHREDVITSNQLQFACLEEIKVSIWLKKNFGMYLHHFFPSCFYMKVWIFLNKRIKKTEKTEAWKQ